jgi:hypothetical protein
MRFNASGETAELSADDALLALAKTCEESVLRIKPMRKN